MRGVGGGCATPARLLMGVFAKRPDEATALDNGYLDAGAGTRRHAPDARTLRPRTREFLAAILHEHGLGTNGHQAPAQGGAQCQGRPVHSGRDHETRLRNEDGSAGLREIRNEATMKKSMERLILLSALACAPLCGGDARMTAADRTKVLTRLEESRKEFLSAIDGVTEQQWTWKPAPDRWSVGEVAEHIVLAEAALFGNLKKAMSSPGNPDWEEKTKGKTVKLEAILAPRIGKATAPEALVP